MPEYIFSRSGYVRPALQLKHYDIFLSFHEDRVDGEGTLHLEPRESPAQSVELDARDLELKTAAEVLPDGSLSRLRHSYDAARRKLVVPLSRPYAPGETVKVRVKATIRPDDVKLEGIYRDTTPPGCPQQYMSQCQQFGFQRILPVVDDCTAKCTFRTTLEGDSRYTHLISNGDPDPATNPGGVPVPLPRDKKRKRITYVNSSPMAPYLFIAAAGTWDVLEDSVTYPDSGKTVRLEYLVPPGRKDGARVPMEILKKSVLFQHEATGYTYPYSTYRTICMEKSLYGGMENTGNTTIVTDAALIDSTVADSRLYYAYGVIPHEYEHNHCGSGVTMETVFDMWLNEAYTVNIERAFMASVFGAGFVRRREVAAMRSPSGPLAEEDTGRFGRIVRDGCNDPDEVVDGVTYIKAPEVLNTLEHIIGREAYEKGARIYFSRYAGGNANTEQFLDCFSEASGRDVRALMREWLFTAGYPRVTVRHAWDAERSVLRIAFFQTRTGKGGFFTIPVSYCAVGADGKDIPGTSGVFMLESDSGCVEIPGVRERPAFMSFSRGCGFYGTLRDASATRESLLAQAALDSDPVNRLDAFRAVTDMARTGAVSVKKWAALYAGFFRSGADADILRVEEAPLDRALRGDVRGNCAFRRTLLSAAAAEIGEKSLLAALSICEALEKDAEADGDAGPARCIMMRAHTAAVLSLLSALGTKTAFAALERHLSQARNLTSRVNALSAILESANPRRLAILEREGAAMRKSIGTYTAYLQTGASNPHPEVFDFLAAEERRRSFSIRHPSLSRALFCAFAANNAQLWTARGLAWLEGAIVRYAKIGEYNALRLVKPLQGYAAFPPALSRKVKALLSRLRSALPKEKYPALNGRLSELLG